MARVRLIHWNGPEGRERKLRLASLGHEAEYVDGDPQKVAQLEALLPDATYTTWGRVKTALPRARLTRSLPALHRSPSGKPSG